MLGKKKFKHMQKLEIANSTLLLALITEMDEKGLIDGIEVLKNYNDNLDEMIEKLTLGGE